MDEQDKLLVISLQRLNFKLPANIENIAQINGDVLQSICIQSLQKLGQDTKLLTSSKQTFRVATKLSEDLNKHAGLRIDLNSLMNPQLNDLRKAIVHLISKISLSDAEPVQIKNESVEEKIKRQKDAQKKLLFTDWLSTEWIHPCLLDQKNQKNFRTFETNIAIDSKSIRRQLIIQNFDKETKVNLFSSLSRVIDLGRQKVEEQEQYNEQIYQGGDMRQVHAQKHELQIEQMRRKNIGEWKNLNQKKKVGKLAKKMQIQESKQEQNEKDANNENPNENNPVNPDSVDRPTFFSQQVEFTEEKKQNDQDENEGNQGQEKAQQKQYDPQMDLDGLRKKNKVEMDALMQEMDEIVKKLQKYESKKTVYEESIQKNNEELENYKEANSELQKQVESLHLLINQMEIKDGNKALKKDIESLEKEIDQIEVEWEKTRTAFTDEIDEFKYQVSEKKEKLDQMREKAKRLETDYGQLVQDIRSGYDQRENLVLEYKSMPKEGSREVYVKRIIEITQNYYAKKQEILKTIQEIKDLEDNIRNNQNSLERYYVEFENAYHTDSKKNESLSKQIFKIYKEYREQFETMIQNLNDLGRRKIEVRELDLKVDLLNSKQYKQSVERVKRDLQEIKQENFKLQQQFSKQ